MPIINYTSEEENQHPDCENPLFNHFEEPKFLEQADKWSYFQKDVLPKMPSLLKPSQMGARIWVMCNQDPTELCTLIILVHDFYESLNFSPKFKVFITKDTSGNLQEFSTIKWDISFLQRFSQSQQDKYFYPKDGGYFIHPFLESHATHLVHDCLNDPPFTGMDMILFQNHIKIQNPEIKNKLLSVCEVSLQTNGFLITQNEQFFEGLGQHKFMIHSRTHFILQKNDSPKQTTTTIAPSHEVSTLDKINELEQELISTRKQMGRLIEKYNFIQHELKLTNKEVYQKQKELEIEKQFRFLTDYAPAFIWLSKLNQSRYHFNQYWMEFTGRTLEEETGRGWLENVHPDDQKIFRDTYDEAYAKQESFQVFYRLRRHDGIYRWILERGRPRFTHEGVFLGFIGSCIDFTEEKETKEQLRQSNEELEQFAYVATHDLRAPISNLLSLIEIFYDQELITPENGFIINKIKQSTREVHDTLHDLIDVVAINKNLDTTIKCLDFQQIYQQVSKGIEEHIQKSGAQIKVDFSRASSIYYIPSHLRSIFQNLLTNAVKYRSPDRVPQIEVSTYPVSEYTCIKIKDNGIGIDMHKKDKVFGLFQRLNESTEGKGIGLFVTKSQVESKGGKINFESELNRGSTFYVYLLNLSK